ncbi:Hsp20 family protein [Oceanobacillus sp. 143]|uniref:Heat-shock protein n=2 Tax=Oceanobacillus zhaokaii TaxID=2052660 RepID=A0A345PMG3_9BACI|nr:heat-shock protein [Oceanobacillus zhaokaii]QGS69946.1 Hsp20 family protein [Oceanobacillus sp. 143]
MRPLRDFMGRMDNLFNQSFKQINNHIPLRSFWVDVNETDTAIIIEASLQGYKPEQIQLEIIDNKIRIDVVESNIIENNRASYSKKQYFQQKERIITLPFTIPEEETKASFKNGILKITVPKDNSKRKFLSIDE